MHHKFFQSTLLVVYVAGIGNITSPVASTGMKHEENTRYKTKKKQSSIVE